MNDETERTREVVTRYHQCWMNRDVEGVLAMFHPQVQYCDFYNDLEIPASELPGYIRTAMPRSPQHHIEHIDQIRADGDTAFIQYRSRLTLRRSSRLASFRASEAITVRDGLIWRVHEYATPVREQREEGVKDQRRLGLNSAQVGKMLLDIESYFGSAHPYLDPEMDLERLARATGYTRNQISYLLNQVLGQSFYRYLNQARIGHLLERLREEPTARIDELAFAVGFNSLSVFYRCFREHTGQPPRAYLAALQEGRPA